MNWKVVRWRLRYAIQYFPFTINTVLFGFAVWGAHRLLYQPVEKGDIPSPFMPFIVLMGKVTLAFIFLFILVSVVSTLFCYFHYLILKSQQGNKLQVEFSLEASKGKKNKMILNARIDGALRPILGFVSGRLLYDDNRMTGRFGLMSNKRREQSIWRTAVTGKSSLTLPDIKEYEIKGGFVYFQDMLHLFSFASVQAVAGHFYQPPLLTEEEIAEVSPKKTESMDVRIEQLRRVEGEYLNYKDFEAGDDVRRIVWKVYAKNRDLVVRVPELYEPYASHLYFYASFQASVKSQWLGEGYLKEMLNYYKNNVWTIYDALSRKEWELRYIPDQEFHQPENLAPAEQTARTISNSNWQNDNTVNHYFNARTGTVLCISSLADPRELANVLDRCDASTVVYFVKLTKVFRHFVPLNLLARLVFQTSDDRLNRLRTSWTFSPIRIQIQKREQEIIDLLSKSQVNWGEV